jgi:bacillithiol biosynthesis cysteine-adding enzyme BshC
MPPDFDSVIEMSRSVLPAHDFSRARLAKILRRQNRAFGADDTTFRHIDQLQDPGTVAIVTGQQVGLFTGPLYTVYKALSAIRIAQRLRAMDISAVPVFWMDSEDHDLTEITHATLVGDDSQVRTVDFLPVLFDPAPGKARPTGSILLPPSVETAIAGYASALPHGRHREQVLTDIRAAYQPGVDFATAFARLLARLFHGRGLILFEPRDGEAKQILSPVFREAVRNTVGLRHSVLERSRLLAQQGLHAQVTVFDNSTVLFLEHEGERRALTVQEGRFHVKGSDASFSEADLACLSENEPERFSPNVLLRPIAQDFLFPTAAYVAGPAETAYFAQIQVLYPAFRRAMPVIWPRDSFTLLEPEVSARMESYHVRLQDCLEGERHLAERMFRESKDASALSILSGLRAKLEREIDGLRPVVAAADASLGPALDTARRKVLHQIETLQAKFVHFESRRDSHFTEVANFLLAHCYPNRSLQERQLGIHRFTARFGPALLDLLYGLCAADDFAHGVVHLVTDSTNSR